MTSTLIFRYPQPTTQSTTQLTTTRLYHLTTRCRLLDKNRIKYHRAVRAYQGPYCNRSTTFPMTSSCLERNVSTVEDSWEIKFVNACVTRPCKKQQTKLNGCKNDFLVLRARAGKTNKNFKTLLLSIFSYIRFISVTLHLPVFLDCQCTSPGHSREKRHRDISSELLYYKLKLNKGIDFAFEK